MCSEDENWPASQGLKPEGDLVDIYVGPSRQHFRILKTHLCSRVPFFHAMFTSGFRESYSQTASFQEDDPMTFSLFVEWLYTDALSPIPKCAVLSSPMDQDIEYIKLYAFAEKICEDHLANAAMTSLRSWYKYTHTLPDLDAMSLACEVTMPRSPLRRLMVEVLAWDVVFSRVSRNETWCRPGKIFCPLLWSVLERCEDLAVDFIVLLLQVARGRGEGEGGSERWGMGNPLERGHCLYHVHEKGEEVCAYSEDNVDRRKIKYYGV